MSKRSLESSHNRFTIPSSVIPPLHEDKVDPVGSPPSPNSGPSIRNSLADAMLEETFEGLEEGKVISSTVEVR